MSDIINMHSEGEHDPEQLALIEKMNNLLTEHRDLDEVIDQLMENPASDQLKIQRLKKRKLILKDELSRVREKIRPDIIA